MTRLWPVALVGLAAAAACGAAWALLIATTRSEIGFAAVGVGWAVGQGVRRAADGRRGRPLQGVAAGCALFGLVLGKYFFIAHMIREMLERQRAPVPAWWDPRMVAFFARVLPKTVGLYDALWAFLALSMAWRALQPTPAPAR